MVSITSNNDHLRCNQCDSKLIVVKKKTEKIEGNRSPVTFVTYRCSDKTCQEDIDKKTDKRLKLQEEQEQAKQNRINIKLGMRLNKNKIMR